MANAEKIIFEKPSTSLILYYVFILLLFMTILWVSLYVGGPLYFSIFMFTYWIFNTLYMKKSICYYVTEKQIFFLLYWIIPKTKGIESISRVEVKVEGAGRNTYTVFKMFINDDDKKEILSSLMLWSVFGSKKLANLLTFLHSRGTPIDRESFRIVHILFDEEKQEYYAKKYW